MRVQLFEVLGFIALIGFVRRMLKLYRDKNDPLKLIIEKLRDYEPIVIWTTLSIILADFAMRNHNIVQ